MTHLVTALALVLQAVLPRMDGGRLEDIAQDVVEVVEEEVSQGNVRLATSLGVNLLSTVAITESGLKESVEDCTDKGDGGRSIGLGQVMGTKNWEGHTKAEICSNRKLQLRLALHVLDRCWSHTVNTDATFRCYTSGDSAVPSAVANRDIALYARIKRDVAIHMRKIRKARDAEMVELATHK